jgi:PKD domain/Secretion system C-terminal sorting domain/Kazal-type serine protease inhibitor domain
MNIFIYKVFIYSHLLINLHLMAATKRTNWSIAGAFFFLLSHVYSTQAQTCTRVGWVAASGPCGLEVIDLDSKQKILLTGNTADLWVGRTFSFDGNAVPGPPSCGGLSTYELACLTDTLPIKSGFGFERSASNHKQFFFTSDVYDPNAQQCTWQFSDGAVAEGKAVEHVFAEVGTFSVTLKVQDKWGGTAQETKMVEVQPAVEAYCNFDAQVTVVGTEIQGKMIPLASSLQYKIESIAWYFHKSAVPVSTSEKMTLNMTDPGTYVVKTVYSIRNHFDGSLCSTEKKQLINITESSCYAPLGSGILASVCPPTDAPVCGCDGKTYKNECEAIKSGVSSWWIGGCAALGNCVAEYKISSVSTTLNDGGYWIKFKNNSIGTFSAMQIDFGDGSPLWEGVTWDSISHYYATEGVYRVNFSAWNGTQCLSSYEKIVSTDLLTHNNTHQLPGTDYILPGDANGDRVANAYDLLNIGVGYYATGAPRPNATTEWMPQFGPNWDHKVNGVVNYKHLDADGNGTVNVFDTDPIEQYYTPLDNTPLEYAAEYPKIWLKHNLPDTIVIDPLNPSDLEFEADIMIGSPDKPVLDIYGLAFSVEYPEFIKHTPVIDYDDNSFFGPINHVLTLSKDIHNRMQIDAGFVRRDGNSTAGYGKLATLSMRADFIIIVDIIERTSGIGTPFVLPINALYAIDEQGMPKTLSRPSSLDSVFVMVTGASTIVGDKDLEKQILLSPNPTSDKSNVWAKDLKISHIEAHDALGKKVLARATDATKSLHEVETAAWNPGVYSLRLFTDKGIVEKRLVVLR